MQDPMYVRTTYATGDPARIDAALDGLRSEAPGLLQAQPGFRRFGLFADRDLGKILIGSWWDSDHARAASDRQLGERRRALLAPFAATVATEEWEAVSYTPAPQLGPGAGMRTGRLEFDPSEAEHFADTFVGVGRPKLEAIDGLVGATLFMNAEAGCALVGTLFRDRAAMAASRAAQAAVRSESLKVTKVQLVAMEEYELVALARPDA
ncbi:hypothetical protein ACPA54_34400 [Uniformispora flossi]|uniref:hypothetical protein n=1 Tax=Uniformispora flossi TaxID=3390723 RepID=UPI003C2C61E5